MRDGCSYTHLGTEMSLLTRVALFLQTWAPPMPQQGALALGELYFPLRAPTLHSSHKISKVLSFCLTMEDSVPFQLMHLLRWPAIKCVRGTGRRPSASRGDARLPQQVLKALSAPESYSAPRSHRPQPRRAQHKAAPTH